MEFPVLENLLRTEAQQLCSVALLRHLEPGAKVVEGDRGRDALHLILRGGVVERGIIKRRRKMMGLEGLIVAARAAHPKLMGDAKEPVQAAVSDAIVQTKSQILQVPYAPMVALLEGNPELLGALRDAAELHGRIRSASGSPEMRSPLVQPASPASVPGRMLSREELRSKSAMMMPLQGSARSVLLEPPTAEEVAAAAAQRPDQGGQGQKNVVAAVTESLSDLWGGVVSGAGGLLQGAQSNQNNQKGKEPMMVGEDDKGNPFFVL